MLIKRILDKFDYYKTSKGVDNLDRFSMEFEVNSLPDVSVFFEIEELLKEYSARDKFKMSIKSSDDDFFNILYDGNNINYTGSEYIVKGNEVSEILDLFNKLTVIEDKVQIKITITKGYKEGFISIYKLDSFINWILKKNLYGIMTLFSSLYETNNNLVFISYDEDVNIVTDTFRISKDNKSIQNSLKRKRILTSRLDITNIQHARLNIIPEDFNVKEYDYVSEKLKNKLGEIRDILSIIHISNISLVESTFLEFRINGYKSSDFKIFYEDINSDSPNDHLYEMYRWIYNDGNLIDKATIARNIVSLHCRYQDILKLDSESLNSIEANYAYYLKTNTDNFLEEKKNLRLLIIEEGKLLSEILYGFIGNLGKNLLAYFTFLATLVVSTTLSEGKFEDIFTTEMVQIIALIILGSFLFLIFSNIETSSKKKRVKDYMSDLVEGYGLILGKENVISIMEKVKSYKSIEKSFYCFQATISVLWVLFNTILLLVLDWLAGDIMILGILNIFK